MASIPNSRIITGIRKLHDGRDGWSEAVKVINAMVDAVQNLVIFPSSGTSLSYDLGNNILVEDVGGGEAVVWQRTVPYVVFSAAASTATIALRSVSARSESGTAVFSFRLGGTDRGVDGTVIATTSLASSIDPGFSVISMSATIPNLGSGFDYLKLTIMPGAGAAKIKEGGVTLS